VLGREWIADAAWRSVAIAVDAAGAMTALERRVARVVKIQIGRPAVEAEPEVDRVGEPDARADAAGVRALAAAERVVAERVAIRDERLARCAAELESEHGAIAEMPDQGAAAAGAELVVVDRVARRRRAGVDVEMIQAHAVAIDHRGRGEIEIRLLPRADRGGVQIERARRGHRRAGEHRSARGRIAAR